MYNATVHGFLLELDSNRPNYLLSFSLCEIETLTRSDHNRLDVRGEKPNGHTRALRSRIRQPLKFGTR